MNNKHPVRTPEDLKGLKLSTQDIPIIIKGFQTLGAEVTPRPWNWVLFDALAQGIFDGMEIDIDLIVAFESIAGRNISSLTDHIDSPAVTLMAMPVYPKSFRMPTSRRLWRPHGALHKPSAARTGDADTSRLAQLIGYGMKINTDVDKAVFRAALAPVYAEWRQQFGDLIERIQAYQ